MADEPIKRNINSSEDAVEGIKVKDALRQSEEKFRTLFNLTKDAIFIHDLEGRMIEANQEACERYGYSHDEFLNMNRSDIVTPEQIPLIPERIETLRRQGYHLFESVHRGRGGTLIPTEVSVRLFESAGKQMFLAVCRDITERKRAEEALEKRIIALTRPLDDIRNIVFEDLFSLSELQRLQDMFAEVWGVAALITRPDGTPITQPGNFTYFCSEFIRKNEKGWRNCQISDATLGRHNPSGPIIHRCLSAGLCGAGASITVGGRHIASWLIGQVRNEAQSEEEIMEYAREIGADETEFREAFLKVPVMPQEKFEKIAHTLFALANQLSTTAYQNIQQARFITERKKAEDELRRSEQILRATQKLTKVGGWEWDVAKQIMTWTEETYRIHDFDPTDFLPGSVEHIERSLKCYRLKDRPVIQAAFQRCAERGEPYDFDFPFTTATGRRIWIRTTAEAVMAEGRVLRVIGNIMDITERKHAEEALRESEARFRLVVESSPLAIGLADQDGRIDYVNPKFIEMFGYTIEDIPTVADWFRLAYPDPVYRENNLERWQKALEKAVHTGGSAHGIEAEVTCKDGLVRIAEVFGTPMGNKILAIFNDITERKRMEDERHKLEVQMREVQKLESLGVLAGGIAHDFNNLLMAILGRADLALFSLSPASPAYQHVEEITRASHRAADLCRQMLAYSGKGRFVVSRYDISEIIREMEQILEVSISKNAMMRSSLADGLPAVESDATQIRQVIMNLITNASDALDDMRGIITVTTGVMECDEAYLSESYLDDKLPGGTYVTLEVSDTGCGMDSETIRRIFDPFFTTKFTGRGLGLAAVLGIVRGHKGAIKVYSEVGKGTTMKVLLPAVEWKPGERAKPVELSESLKSGGTILLIDDDLHVRDIASDMLEHLGFQVLTASNGREGLNVFQTHGNEIACVLLDLTMPEMGGEEAFRELRKLRSDVRVILSSGYNEQDVTQRFIGRGLAGFIQKPYTVANLRSALSRALG